MRNALRFLDEYYEKYTASILFVVFSSVMIANVFMRYVVGNAIPWAEELTLFLFVWFAWLAIPYATKLDNHARVTILHDLLPPIPKLVLNLLLNGLAVMLFVWIIIASMSYLGHAAVRGKTGLLINYPMWSFYVPAPIGLSLTVYRVIRVMARDLTGVGNPDTKGAR